MKNQTGIWIDGSKAQVITINNGKETVSEIVAEIENSQHHPGHEQDKGTFMGTHHLNHERKIEQRIEHEKLQFLDKVIEEAKNANEVFIMGPSGMKRELQKRMQSNKQLESKLKGLVTTDYLTLNQCVAKVREFYEL